MTDRRVRLRRRLTAWLAAALLGAAGALTFVTPAHAAATCTVTLRAIAWPTIDGQARWDVEATMTNTSMAQSLGWTALIAFPYSSGAVIPQYWNVKRSPFSAYLWLPAAWNKVILPGKSANFGFEVDMPSWDVSPLPTSSSCSITY
jgi:hypothetical protein